jgi:hypothetical protein
VTAPDGRASYIELTGLSRDALGVFDAADLSDEQWSRVLRVAVAADAPPMLGTYSIAGSALRFTPRFPLDPGRPYDVRFDPAHLPGGAPAGVGPAAATVSLPAVATVPSTVVARVYPSGDAVPENLLRMYLVFSAPMGRRSGIDHIRLLGPTGQEIEGAVLPLDYEFWSPDHTRFTVFFDPGRVKKGILPNREMGRPLEIGTTVTLVVGREWRDQHDLPLMDDFRRVYRVGPPEEQPLDTASWRIEAPRPGGRDGVVVTFPKPLDHGLLMRALGVTRGGTPVEGESAVSAAETRWTFTPRDPWREGAYELQALDILEDTAGNQIGRAFEVDNFGRVDSGPNPQAIAIPFHVGPRATQ